MKNLADGKKPGVTSLQFDQKNFNIFHMVQKIHVLNVEIAHVALGKSAEDNTFIIDKKKTILKAIFLALSQVSNKRPK